jgi:hypothetical protein
MRFQRARPQLKAKVQERLNNRGKLRGCEEIHPGRAKLLLSRCLRLGRSLALPI